MSSANMISHVFYSITYKGVEMPSANMISHVFYSITYKGVVIPSANMISHYFTASLINVWKSHLPT